jgi:hypothetical protein
VHSRPRLFSDRGRYCTHINVDHRAALLGEKPAMYMNFIDWMARTSRKKKKQTYSDYWKRLCYTSRCWLNAR